MKVYEALAHAFVAEGATDTFGLMGDANQYFIDALTDRGARWFHVRHEGDAAAMADGYARATGRVGVCTTTSGPGTTHLATSLMVAARASTPLVVFSGDVRRGDAEAGQAMDQKAFADSVETAFVRVRRTDSAYEVVRKAFYLARTESRPVMVSAAMDLQQEAYQGDDEYVPSTSLLIDAPIAPGAEAIARAADLLGAAQRPVVIVGQGAGRSGAGAAVLRLAERTGALVATTMLIMNWLRDKEPFHAGISGLSSTRAAMELFLHADCVVAVGTSLNRYTTEQGCLFPGARYLQVDVAPQLVMGSGRVADCYLRADARLGVEALDAELERRGIAGRAGYRTPDVAARLAEALRDPVEYELPPGTVDPRAACRDLDEMLPGEIGLTIGIGHHSHFGTMLFTRERPFILTSKGFGSIGRSMTTAIGAAVATGQPVCFLEGDASLLMHLSAFETAARYRVPVLGAIFNDEGLGAEFHKASVKGLHPELARMPTPDLAQLAMALGGMGAQVRSLAELRDAVTAFVRDPKPTLLDIRVAPNVVAVQYRRLWFGRSDV